MDFKIERKIIADLLTWRSVEESEVFEAYKAAFVTRGRQVNSLKLRARFAYRYIQLRADVIELSDYNNYVEPLLRELEAINKAEYEEFGDHTDKLTFCIYGEFGSFICF